MTYEEYLAQEQLAMEEEQNDGSCFLEISTRRTVCEGTLKMEARSLHFLG